MLGLLFGAACLIPFVMFGFTRLFGVEQIGTGDSSHIVFHGIEKKSGEEEFVIVVTPEGWQNTKINLNEGDNISFLSGGQVCNEEKLNT